MFVFVYDIFSVSNLILIVILYFQTAKSVLFRGLMVLNTLVIVQPQRVDRRGYGQQARLSTSFVDNAIGFCSVLFTLVVDTGISLQHRM